MDKPIGWGILATGGIAATFVTDLARLPDARPAAVASRSRASAERFAATFDVPHAHVGVDALIDDPDVDIVYIAGPHSTHHAAAKRCLSAGKPVLCEKAFTVNHRQAAELVDLARDRKVFLMEAMWMRCLPAVRRLAEVIGEGTIGEVTAVTAGFGLAGPFPPDHRLRDPALAGGALLDLGVYPLALAQLLLGPPVAVTSTGTLTSEGVDAAVAMAVRHDGGAVASLSCAINADIPATAIISGHRGHITVPAPFYRPDRLIVGSGDGENASSRVIEAPRTGVGLCHEAAEAMRCLRQGRTQSPLVPWQDTLDVMATMDEVRRQIGVRYPGESVD